LDRKEPAMPMDVFDLIFVVSAVLFNLLIAGVFIAQKSGQEGAVRILGIIWLSLGIPLTVVFVKFLFSGEKETGIIVSYVFVLIYMLVEFLLDYVYKFDFRSKNVTHIPYILLEYVALFGVIMISFDIHPTWGWIVSICFWLLMGSLVYLYWDKIFPRKQNNQ
jgi:hypothetical protein